MQRIAPVAEGPVATQMFLNIRLQAHALIFGGTGVSPVHKDPSACDSTVTSAQLYFAP
jgi:hypothetical protein